MPYKQRNYNEVVRYARKDKENVVLLLGNHDIHYLIDEEYSGFQYDYAIYIRHLLENDKDMFKVCHIQDKLFDFPRRNH